MTEVTDFEARLATARQASTRLREAIGQVIVGQKDVVDQTLWGILAGGHVLLEGAPGLGKTLLVRTLSQCLDLVFSRIQFTPDLMPSDVTGTNVLVTTADGQRAFALHKGPIFGQVVLADEINRATPKTQSALLEAMAEHTVSVEGKPRPVPSPFFVLATENPIEMEGVFPLPEAQLDRFLMKLVVKMPDLETLARIGARAEEPAPPAAVTCPEELLDLQKLVRKIPSAPHVELFAAKLVLATGAHPGARYGAGPRAVQALMSCGRARALLDGRAAVAVDDLKAVAPAILRHRIGLKFEAEAKGIDAEAIAAHAVASVEP
jgi:MoxR-like ATPase